MEPEIPKPSWTRHLSSTPVPGLVVGSLVATFALFACGLILLRQNPELFRVWIREDSITEWLTFVWLMFMTAYAAAAAAGFRRDGNRAAFRTWVILAAVLFFGGMEEISWGQRVFGWGTPAWLCDAAGFVHNSQQETNFHNLVVGGVKLNKLIFGKFLAIVVAFHLIVTPILYRKVGRYKSFLDARGIPVPQTYQIALFLAMAWVARSHFDTASKASELLEFEGVFLFLVMLVHPLNRETRPKEIPLFSRIEARRARAWASIAGVFRRLPARLRCALLVVGTFLAVFTAFRFLFWAVFAPVSATGGAAVPFDSWYLGFKFDLRLALLIYAPVLLFSWIPGVDIVRSRIARRCWMGYLMALAVFCTLLYFMDIGHYDHLNERLTARIIDELHGAREAAGVVTGSYPVVWAVLAFAFVLFVFALGFWRLAFAELDRPGPALSRRANAAVAALAILLCAAGIYGKWARIALRWSDAYFTTNSFASALALNPVLHFFDTLNTVGQEGYDAGAVREHYDEVAAYLGVDAPDRERLSFSRGSRPEARLPGRPNIVIVSLESFAAFKTGTFGNPLDPTPEFDKIAKESTLFRQFYVPCGPTARSIFTTFFGIPDVNPLDSASRNPRIVRQHTLYNAFDGYEKLYFVGGSASWGNIRAMLAHNIDGLRLYEEGSYSIPRTHTWGAYDLQFLEEVNKVLRAETKPFVAFIQTSGNHRPFTIPDDRRDFQLARVDTPALTAAGFNSLEQYNSLRFMDYSLGNFIRLAREEAYFKNTIFVMFGDHGTASTPGLPDVSLKLRRHHVPLAIYAPALLGGPRVTDSVASSLDVFPTLAGLAGMPYVQNSLGFDLFDPRERKRYAFIDEIWHMGLIDDEFFLAMDASGQSALYRYRSETFTEDVSGRYPEVFERMRRLCRGLHETSRYLLYHNKPPR